MKMFPMHGALRAACLIALGCLTLLGAGDAGAAQQPGRQVFQPQSRGVSLPFSQLPAATTPAGAPTVIPLHKAPWRPATSSGSTAPVTDPALQTIVPGSWAQNAHIKFPGTGYNGYYPSDSNIAVGTTAGGGYVVEAVNASVTVFNKSGTRISGPVSLRSFWSNLGGYCATVNGGDPVIVYDSAADRWLMTQIAYDSTFSNNFQCVAVSQTNDPRGAYNLYSYAFGSTLNDFPKFSVWPTATNSAYLATFNLFPNKATTWGGGEICAYDRTAMLTGGSANVICFKSTGSDLLYNGSFLPSDFDGPTKDITNLPNEGPLFLSLDTSSTSTYQLDLYQLNGLDFANSGGSLQPRTLAVAPFTFACPSSACIPQKGTTRLLESLGDRLNFRLAYRVFPDHTSMVVTHPVKTASGAALRWYELRKQATFDGTQCDSSLPFVSNQYSLCQQGTYAPNSNSRWMGSAAMDGAGNIAIGYSLSSSTVYPSIAYALRTPGMTPGTLGPETILTPGAGYQSSNGRWGDYSSLRVDPDDDKTFWYVNEYYAAGAANWSTAINNFSAAGVVSSPSVAFGAATYSFSEAAGTVNIPVTRTDTTSAATVDYATASGTATSGTDFNAASGTLSFSAGVATMYVPVTIIDDNIPESNETFTVNLSNPTGGMTLGQPATTTVTIIDNDSTQATALQNGVSLTNLSGAAGSQKYYSISVPSGRSSLKITTSGGSGNSNLYVRLNALPTLSTYNCRSRNSTNTDSCSFFNPSAGTYYIMLYGSSSYSGLTLKATYQ